jgi:hypothetical protein
MKRERRPRKPSRTRQSGWAMSEYLAVLVGLLVVWWGAEGVLGMIQEHHDEYTWALMMPY